MTLPTMKISEKVAVITFNNPPANALSSKVLMDLKSKFESIQHNDEVRAVVLHGEGRFFSAGADIKEFTSFQTDEGFESLAKEGHGVFTFIETFNKPVIAAIHGAALGGGLELSLSCHIRVATEHAKIGLPELQLGIIPGYGGTQRLPRTIGRAHALEMILSSEPITGKKALTIGLINHLFEEDTLLDDAIQLAKKFTNKSPRSVADVLYLTQKAVTEELEEGLQEEAKAFSEIFNTEDAKEGIQAFIEKRQPHFKGN